MLGKNYNILNGLIDYQIGECHGNIPFNVDEYVKATADIGIKELIFTCKDAYGVAYYNSKLIPKNAVIHSDYLQEAIEAGRKYGVDIHAYYNILLDDKVADEYPEYRMRNSNGEPIIAYDFYKILCPNSPYVEILKKRVSEIAENYDIKGYFTDITYFQEDTCYCKYCREKFEIEYGYPLKTQMKRGSKELRDWSDFKRKSRFDLISGFRSAIAEKKENLKITWNGSGSYALADIEVDKLASYITTEFHAPEYLDGIIRAKWSYSKGKEFILTTPAELGSWGDWTTNPEVTFGAVFSTIISNGGGVSVNHVPYPSGEFAASVNRSITEYLKSNGERIKKLEPWLLEAASVADIAVLYSVETRRMYDWSIDLNTSDSYYDSIKGVTKMLLFGNRHFDILSEDDVKSRISSYKVLIIPDAAYLQEETINEINKFSKCGGRVIATNITSLYNSNGEIRENFGLSEVLGIDYIERSNFSVDYIYDLNKELSVKLPDMPILIKKSSQKSPIVSLHTSTCSMGSLIEPLFETTLDKHVYHQHAHPGRRSGHSSIIFNTNGKGKSIYIAPRIFSSFMKTGSPWLKNLFLNCLDYIYESPLISVDAPSSVQVYLMKQKNNLVLHLVNINDAKIDVTPTFMDEMIPVFNINVNLRVQAKKVYIVLEMKELECNISDNSISFTVPEIRVHTTIVIELI